MGTQKTKQKKKMRVTKSKNKKGFRRRKPNHAVILGSAERNFFKVMVM